MSGWWIGSSYSIQFALIGVTVGILVPITLYKLHPEQTNEVEADN